ncbi:MAG TPA: hypothetical protein VEQ63_07020, partial [Bryobacteraceae bacterium]|nr:hypothetical protein [Bryobacteraceae bacterium]
MKCLWLATFLPAVLFSASTAASLARSFQDSGLDVDAAFRVRDLSFQKDDIRFYLTEGRIIFSKPVEGKRFAAFFTTDVDGGDGEVILFPPHKSERLALSSFAKTPNLNEHIKTALFLFTDGTGEQLLQRFQSSQKLEPESAVMLDQSYSPVLRNVAGSYVTRLVQDFLSPGQESQGLFYAVAHGSTLGLFDIVYDPLAREQILVGQMNVRDGQHYFDAWTSFQARPFRTGVKAPPSPPVRVSDIAIDATVAADLSLKATTKLTLTATARTGRALQFELSRRMRVTEAKFDGVPVEVFNREAMRANLTRATSENDVFLVVLPEPIEPGKSHAFEFQHEGNVIMPAGNGVYFVAARSSWYPHRESVFARYDLTFRYPKNFDLVATGTLVDQRTDGDQKIARRRTSQPVRFAGFNIGDYENVSLKQSGLEIAVYANRTVEQALMPRTTELVLVPRVAGTRGAGTRNQELATMPVIPSTPNPKARLHEIAGEISSVMTFLASQLGPPPIETLTVSPIPGTFGQGFAGLIYLSTLSYIPASQRPASL